MKPLLDPIQVGEILGISPRTVNQLCNQKKLQFIQVDSKHRRFTEEMVEEFIKSQTTPSPYYVTGGRVPPVQSPKNATKTILSPGSRTDLKAEMDAI